MPWGQGMALRVCRHASTTAGRRKGAAAWVSVGCSSEMACVQCALSPKCRRSLLLLQSLAYNTAVTRGVFEKKRHRRICGNDPMMLLLTYAGRAATVCQPSCADNTMSARHSPRKPNQTQPHMLMLWWLQEKRSTCLQGIECSCTGSRHR